jgi:hypothetical protein
VVLLLLLISSCASQGYQYKPCPCEKSNKR